MLVLAVMIWLSLATMRVLEWRDDAHKLVTCESSSKRLKGTNDELQASRDRIASNLAASRKRVLKQCTSVIQSDSLKAGAEHAGYDERGITTEWLLGYAAQCETYRSERIALEKFLDAARP